MLQRKNCSIRFELFTVMEPKLVLDINCLNSFVEWLFTFLTML